MKKMVIAGGSGFLGSVLARHYSGKGIRVFVLTRGLSGTRDNVDFVTWDGRSVGAWQACLEGADVLINLTGKSVDCRYNNKNKKLIYSSRLQATQALGLAVQRCHLPPKLWINSSSATIYRHSLDRDMDEYTGEHGSGFSVDVCEKWEDTFNHFQTTETRKVIIRTAIVLGKSGGALQPLKNMVRLGAGGKMGTGDQYMSWLHEQDFIGMIDYIIDHPEMDGVYNLAAPNPIPNRDFMWALRRAMKRAFGMPNPEWMLTCGAWLIRTETELILKSRRAVPGRMLEAGYKFRFDKIENALHDLCK